LIKSHFAKLTPHGNCPIPRPFARLAFNTEK
jgi:hypothetical protein